MKHHLESIVWRNFPQDAEEYQPDVEAVAEICLRRHGLREWRALVLTAEMHGHIGIYASLGAKMGILMREYFRSRLEHLELLSYAGHHPPVSCFNDGLQVATRATLGHGTIRLADTSLPYPAATFHWQGRTAHVRLKASVDEQIRRDVQQGRDLHGHGTAYWEYIRRLALRYWCDFDRWEIFEIEES